MKIYNFDQYSDAWWSIRAKRLTASNAQAIGNCGKGLESYVEEIMCEYSSSAPKEGYKNHHMDRGNELEDSAGMVYSFDRKIKTQKVGFVTIGDYVGCSPDLFAGDDGLAEIKCHADKKHFNLILGGKFESKYVWQGQCQMFICEKKWCDLVSYNPNFKEYLIVHRIKPDPKKVDDLQKGFILGKKMIEEIERKMS